ncbi:hypothetical protein BaRGS_00031673, partial [Batillaria attramentaria]
DGLMSKRPGTAFRHSVPVTAVVQARPKGIDAQLTEEMPVVHNQSARLQPRLWAWETHAIRMLCLSVCFTETCFQPAAAERIAETVTESTSNTTR